MSSHESTGLFSVNGEGGRLTVEVLGYENPYPQTVSDANWLQVQIRLDAGGCSMRIEAALTTQELKHFLDELEGVVTTLEGTASLTTDEETISLQVNVGKRGTAHVSGELRELGTIKVTVKFEFDTDQTLLMRTISELRDLHNQYPVVESV